MLTFVVALLVMVGVAVLFRSVQQKKRAAQVAQNSMQQAARLLGGRSSRDPVRDRDFARVSVLDLQLRLLRESQGESEGDQELTVLELIAPDYLGPIFEIHEQRSAACKTLRPPLDQVIEDLDIDPPVVALCSVDDRQRVLQLLQNDDTRRLVGYALNRKRACLHLSPSGCWFECAGFSADAELLVATVRTAARALRALLHS